MLITPADLIAYTVFDVVKERPEPLLQQDILEAEVEIERIVGHDFSSYNPLPDKAKLALLKMAQFFALINSDESITKGIKSEKIGDYSYTLSDGQSIKKPDVYHLLKEYIIPGYVQDGSVNFRMRAL